MIITSQGPLVAKDRPRKTHEVLVPINLNHITAQIIDPKNDRIIHEGPARSYVSNFIHHLRSNFIVSSISRPTIISDSSSMWSGDSLRTTSATGLDRRGLLVGGSAATTTVAATDLVSRLDAGITYSQMGYTNFVLEEGGKSFDIFRPVHASASVTINEISLCGSSSTGDKPHLFVRDPVSTVSLLAGEARLFRYRLHFDNLWPPGYAFYKLGFTNYTTTVLSTANVSSGASSYLGVLYLNAGINNYLYGTQIGSSELPIAWNAHRIEDAFSSTDFYALAQVTGSVVEAAPEASLTTVREFVNDSGPAKTVRQYALYFLGQSTRNFMLHAGTLPSPIVVQPDEAIKFTYQFTIDHT